MKIVITLISSFIFVIGLLVFQFINEQSTDFRMVFCYVGQGDGIYIRAFSKDIVIDGGPESTESNITECVAKYMPLYDRNIEIMVVTHADGDHYAGFLDLLDRYSITDFVTTPTKSDTLGYNALVNKVKKMGVNIRYLSQGDRITINESLKIDVLWPDREFTKIDSDTNNSSLVFLLDFIDFEALLTGDLDKEYLNLLVNDLNQVEVFKVAHHGSNTSTDDNTFESFTPELSIISAGIKNKFGHPHREVIDVIERSHLNYLTTQKGDIVVTSDGKEWSSSQ